jgi:voltage-gated potassium channel
MTMITITTIGYHEIRPLSEQGKIFNVIFIIASFSTISYLLAKLTQYVVSGDLSQYFKTRRLMQVLEQKQNHVIICGFGRNGQQAAKTLKAHKIDYVVIEKNPETLNYYAQYDPAFAYLLGDATEDDILVKAGVQKAKAILVTLPEDADNVFIVLSARSLNANLQIIGRASHQSATAKLYKAGANNYAGYDRRYAHGNIGFKAGCD